MTLLYRLEPQNPFEKTDPLILKSYNDLMQQLAWEYVNLQAEFLNNETRLVFCSLSVQIIYMIFHKLFQKHKFGQNFLTCLNTQIWKWLCGLIPQQNILNLYPMIKLTNGDFPSDDILNNYQKSLYKQGQQGSHKINRGNGTIVLGMMSGLLDRYCKDSGNSGVGELIGVLTQREIKRTLLKK